MSTVFTDAVRRLFGLKVKPYVEPRCEKCGSLMEHLCGMGACVDFCTKCDRL